MFDALFDRIMRNMPHLGPVHEPTKEESAAFKAGYRVGHPAECDPILDTDASISPNNRHFRRGLQAGAETYQVVKQHSPHLFNERGATPQ